MKDYDEESLVLILLTPDDFDLLNAIPLEQYTSAHGGVHSNHLDYTKALQKWLDDNWNFFYNANGNNSAQAAEEMYHALVGGNSQDGLLPALQNALNEKSIEGTQRVNDLFKNLGSGINDDSVEAVNHIISQYN